MTSWHENAYRIAYTLLGKFIGDIQIFFCLTRTNDVAFYENFVVGLNKLSDFIYAAIRNWGIWGELWLYKYCFVKSIKQGKRCFGSDSEVNIWLPIPFTYILHASVWNVIFMSQVWVYSQSYICKSPSYILCILLHNSMPEKYPLLFIWWSYRPFVADTRPPLNKITKRLSNYSDRYHFCRSKPTRTHLRTNLPLVMVPDLSRKCRTVFLKNLCCVPTRPWVVTIKDIPQKSS